MKRTITIITEQDVNKPKIREELSYLMTWCATGFDQVTIADDGTRDFYASYRNSTDGSRYVIGAIWHEDEQKFSRHS